MPLEKELAFFNEQKKELLEYYSMQYALIKGEELIGTFTTWEEAFALGAQKFGNVPFLIKQVQENEETAQTPALVAGAICAYS